MTEPKPATKRQPEPAAAPRADLSDLLSQLGSSPNDAPKLDASLTDPRDLERPQPLPTPVIESSGGINFEPVFATFGSRALGIAVDTAVTILLMLPGLVLMLVADSILLRIVGGLVGLGGFAVAARLYAVSVAATGRWFGNRLASTEVVDVKDGSRISVSSAAARFVARAFVSPVFMAGFLIALNSPQRRCFHDQLAGSIVTRPARAAWSIDDADQ